MARPGAKPAPTQVKLLQGTARPCRLNPNEPRPIARIPDPPSHLTEDALTEWRRVTNEMAALGIITNLDRGALAAYCQAYGRWVTAETALASVAAQDATSGGLILRTKSGNYIQNPLVGAANKAMSDMVRYAAEFGMTPSARTRVAAHPDDDGTAGEFFN